MTDDKAGSQLPEGPIGLGYICRALIGTGGMGEVYLADQPGDAGESVALKLIRADRAEKVRALRRFTREVRAMARLDHSSIVSVYDYGVHYEESGTRRPFFVLEYVKGPSLRSFLKSGPTIEEALPIIDQILSALAYAHARGVIHRDLKPENVLLAKDRAGNLVPKILDFGIARMVDDDALDEETVARLELELADGGIQSRSAIDELSTVEFAVLTGNSAEQPEDDGTFDDDGEELITDEHDAPGAVANRLTQLNQCVGTPAYLAPEQIRPRRHGVGPASDLYALGIMLFELVCGKRPFRARTPRELLKMHLVAPIPDIVPRDGIAPPETLLRLTRRLLAKHPHRRPSYAADVRRELRAIMTGREIVPPPVPALDATASSVSLSPAQAEPGSSQLNDREEEERTRPIGLGLLKFREPPLVGRNVEQGTLWRRFTDAHESVRLQVVILDGEAGMGKSRLVRWLRERAEELGLARTFIAPWDAGPGGGGLRAAMERYLMCKGLEGEALVTRVTEELRRLDLSDEWITSAFVNFLRPKTSDGGTVVQSPLMSTAYSLTDTVLRRFAETRPVILQLDNIHTASNEAIDLLRYLLDGQRASPYPCLVIATVHSEDLLTDHGLREQLDMLAQHPDVTRLTLEPLPPEKMCELIRGLVPIDKDSANQLAQHSGGHPLFAIQMVNHWVEGGVLVPADDGRTLERAGEQAIPTRINEVVDRRVASFLGTFGNLQGVTPAVAQAILEWIAIIGEPVEFGLLVQLAAGEGIGSNQIDVVWEAALVDGLCVEDGIDSTLHFSHRIIGKQLLDWASALPTFESRQEHCAEAKLRLVGRDPVQQHLEVSQHLFAANEKIRGWRHEVYAARCALDLSRYQLAQDRLRRALDMLAKSDLLSDEVSRAEQFEARRAYLDASLRLNRLDDVEAELGRLGADIQQDPWRAGWLSLLGAEMESRRGHVDSATEGFQRALVNLRETHHDEDRAKALRGLASCLARAGQLQSALEALDEAEPIARESGDQNLLAEVLLSRGVIYFDDGAHDLSERYLAEALEVFTANSNILGIGQTHLQLGRIYLILGELQRAERHFESARQAYHVMGDRHGVVQVLNGLGEVARSRRALEQAETAYTQALELSEGFDAAEDEAVVRTNLGLVQYQRGHFDEARGTLSEAAESFLNLGIRTLGAIVCGMLAGLEAETGNFDACNAWLDCIDAMELDRLPADRDFAFALKRAGEVANKEHNEVLAARLLESAGEAFDVLGESEHMAAVKTLRSSIQH